VVNTIGHSFNFRKFRHNTLSYRQAAESNPTSYAGERDTLRHWAENKGLNGLEEYWRAKNTRSIDGFPTGLLEMTEAE
jgi:hypothetical protein